MTRHRSIYAAFAISGVAGLVYEVLWTRYLGLYVGHSAYAQVLVLAVYLGGMAVGSLAIADLSKRLDRPLVWYAVAEGVLALFGFAFHFVFVWATDVSYDVIFPAIGGASWVGAARWGLAGALILPQAMVLGTTFPLMAAGLVRTDLGHPGRSVARVYLLNTLGGSAGVLLAGFWMIGRFGLPGTSIAAALLNSVAVLLVWSATRAPAESAAVADDASELDADALTPLEEGVARPRALAWLLLTISFGTALASFAYEIGWIRMLSLVLGSATHAFELMLSAFILGLALGAWLIRDVTDRSRDPVRLLGGIQVLMGLAALLSLPLYAASFDIMSALVQSLPGRTGGYALFNLSRYGLCLLVMLPSTMLAGMTLPVITGSLLRSGAGEAMIGRVYGVNTIGSVAGAGLAGLFALPLLGLKGLIIAGAALDVLLGLWLLSMSARWFRRGWPSVGLTVGVSVAAFASVHVAVTFSPDTLTSGVFREGDLPDEGGRRSLFYHDGRTATVSAHIGTGDGIIVLATNGKPDASLGPRWIIEGRDTLAVRPIPAGRDFTTQALAPMVALAHRPDARSIANIGHGSGMTAASFLTSDRVERLVTIEIEPLMVEGSLVFLPANGPAFADPRVSYVFDDAKSYFSYQQERFDIVFAEPSNPWVSGTASLFTREFYEQVTDFMSEGAVLAQWIQLYELNDDLFLSVLAALDAVFPSYRAYLVGDLDVAIVARADGDLGDPDWSVVDTDRFHDFTASAPRFHPGHMEALLLFDETTFKPVLDRGVAPNSDYRPTLDLGAERARFEHTAAEGTYSFATSRVDLGRLLSGRTTALHSYNTVPAYGLESALLWGRGAWLREAMVEGGGISPEEFPEWMDSLVHLQTFFLLTAASTQLGRWDTWAAGFIRAESDLHWGTTSWVDTTFYRNAYDFLDRDDGPAEARATVDLMHGFSLQEWERVATAADRLVTRVAAGERWVPPALLLDVAVIAYLRTGRTAAARNAVELLAPRTGRVPSNLRNRLLDALVSEAERARGQ